MRLSRGDFEMSATLGNLSIDKFQIIMHKYNKAVLILIALVLILVGKGCMRRSTNEKRYPIKGKVIMVNKLDRTATVAHEDIPGYMPGMTMEFKIKNDGDLEMMKAGDQITGTLVVDDLSS